MNVGVRTSKYKAGEIVSQEEIDIMKYIHEGDWWEWNVEDPMLYTLTITKDVEIKIIVTTKEKTK